MNARLEDYECALCLKLLVNPVGTSCGHTFCQFCLQQSIDAAIRDRASILQCPLCRTPVLEQLDESTANVLKPNVVLSQLLSSVFPQEYQQRIEEVKQDAEEYNQTQIIGESLYIGNRHSLRARRGDESDNVHEWTFFVRMDTSEKTEKYIDKVIVDLHPTFSPSRITLSRPPFEVRRLGWGIFQIHVQVFWKSCYQKPPEKFSWLLSFDGVGDFTSHDVQFVTRKIPGAIQQPQDSDETVQPLDDVDEDMSDSDGE